MDQIKLVADVSSEAALDQDSAKSNEVRTLSDLEMVLCGGGEGVVNW